mmetsp:Transcript_43270/g.99739  ORF Transcript_43270/g.99739 Transcript_43270/m.99739 type:complete len:210 (+) Transcript_43270:68-697(+)
MSRRADLQQQLLAAVQTLNTLSTQFVSIVNELQTAALETPAQVNVQPVEGTTMMEQLREELQGADPPEEEAMMEECRKELRRPLRIYVAKFNVVDQKSVRAVCAEKMTKAFMKGEVRRISKSAVQIKVVSNDFEKLKEFLRGMKCDYGNQFVFTTLEVDEGCAYYMDKLVTVVEVSNNIKVLMAETDWSCDLPEGVECTKAASAKHSDH